MARETGWQRDFILWHMPLAELLLYQQAAVFLEGRHWLVAPSPPARSQWDALLSNWEPP